MKKPDHTFRCFVEMVLHTTSIRTGISIDRLYCERTFEYIDKNTPKDYFKTCGDRDIQETTRYFIEVMETTDKEQI